jgi:hypothetical protein
MSCEGFGISKIFYDLVDFAKILNPLDSLKQDLDESTIREEKWMPQPEKTADGKTYHAEKVAREEGLAEEIGYHLEGSKISKTEDLMRILYENREVPLVIFDDADIILNYPDKENKLNKGWERIEKESIADGHLPRMEVLWLRNTEYSLLTAGG